MVVRGAISTETYLNTKKTSQIIGKELNANYLFRGSFSVADNNFTMVVQLIDAETDQVIGGKTIGGEMHIKELYLSQNIMAQSIADNLQAKLSPSEKAKIKNGPPKIRKPINISSKDFITAISTIVLS